MADDNKKSLIDTSREDSAAKKTEKLRLRELSDIREVCKTPAGRRLYWRVMEAGSPFRNSFCGENTNGTNYNLGRQSVSMEFLDDLLTTDSRIYRQMQEERESEAQSEENIKKLDKAKSGDIV